MRLFPEILDGMAQISRAGFEQMRQSPMYQAWSEVAPDRETAVVAGFIA